MELPAAKGSAVVRDEPVENHSAMSFASCVLPVPELPVRMTKGLPELAKRVTAHVLRHSTAMSLLQAGVDRSVIALWLGHESMETTQIYLHADLQLIEQALAKTEPFKGCNGRYRPPEQLLAFLQSL